MRLRLVILLSVIGSASYGQTKIFKDNVRGFEFSYPTDWTLDTLTSNPMVLAPNDVTPLKHPASFQVLSEQSQESLDKSFKAHVTDWYPDQVTNFKISAEGSRNINGYYFKWIECQYQNANTTYTKIIYMTAGKGRWYQIEGRASAKKYPDLKSRFMSMINSFRLS